MKQKTSILIIDDHPIIGMAMELLIRSNLKDRDLTLDIVEGGKDGLKKIKERTYDLILLDVNLPDYNIFSLIPNIFHINKDLRILVFTSIPEDLLARRLFSLNVSGFISKKVDDKEILSAINTVLNGGKYISKAFSSEVLKGFMNGAESMNPIESLSEREYQVFMEILKGDSTKEIADKLHISHSSISTYRQRIFEKLQVDNLVELIKKAQQYGITD